MPSIKALKTTITWLNENLHRHVGILDNEKSCTSCKNQSGASLGGMKGKTRFQNTPQK